MRSKDKVLAFLIEQGEEPISGERIAAQIGISRNAVWKAIEALRNEGCEIEAAPRRGYRLRGSADALRHQVSSPVELLHSSRRLLAASANSTAKGEKGYGGA